LRERHEQGLQHRATWGLLVVCDVAGLPGIVAPPGRFDRVATVLLRSVPPERIVSAERVPIKLAQPTSLDGLGGFANRRQGLMVQPTWKLAQRFAKPEPLTLASVFLTGT
jgi:hypothetical protein